MNRANEQERLQWLADSKRMLGSLSVHELEYLEATVQKKLQEQKVDFLPSLQGTGFQRPDGALGGSRFTARPMSKAPRADTTCPAACSWRLCRLDLCPSRTTHGLVIAWQVMLPHSYESSAGRATKINRRISAIRHAASRRGPYIPAVNGRGLRPVG